MSGIGCARVRELLPERVAERLEGTLAESVDAHLALCETCTRERWTVASLAADRPPVPDGLAGDIRRALRAEALRRLPAAPGSAAPVPSRWRARAADVVSRPARRWAVAAVLALAVASTLLLRGAGPPGAPPAVSAELEGTPSVWLAGDGMVAGAPLLDDLSDLSDDDLESLLTELEG